MHENTVIMHMECNVWDFKIESSKPILKIAQKPFWFWKTLNFAKIPKTYVVKNEMHVNERIEAYQVKKNLINLEKCLRKRLEVKERVFGRWTGADRSREIEEMRTES